MMKPNKKYITSFLRVNPQLVFFLLFAFTLTSGFLIYFFFRNENLLVYKWLEFLPANNNVIIFSHPSFLTDFFCYNLPDGLWLLSCLLFLRAVWYKTPKYFLIYKLCFLIIAFLFEISQVFDCIAGTFDVFDLITMGSVALLESIGGKKVSKTKKMSNFGIDAFVEGLLYKNFILRRSL